ncbi:MAG: hypothetical protein A2X18_04210 [Bacteroidetes bacterium GWF2_40_14]|nr:MAG: hypothetical protein A2X18_04210 [Bacteroidetes bacterium GWF2_40_14]
MKFRKSIKIISLIISVLLILMFLLPVVFPRTISEKAKELVNKTISGKLDFGKVGLSFFEHFPNLTVSIYNFSLTGSAPFEKDTLASGRELSLGVDIFSVFGKRMIVDAIYLDGVRLNIIRGKDGTSNYNIIKSEPEVDSIVNKSSYKQEDSKFDLNLIWLKECGLRFSDSSLNLSIEANNLKYKGKGTFADDVFNLESNVNIEDFSLIYDGIAYLNQKNIRGKLKTGINTASFNIKLLENKIKVQDIAALFFGEMTIYEDGYDIDFNLKTDKSSLADLFSLLPPDYTFWIKNTRFAGSAEVSVGFKGSARDSSGMAPDLEVKLDVTKGKISYSDAPFPLEKIFLKGSLNVPGLDPEAMVFKVDTLGFSLNGDHNSAKLLYKGITMPFFEADLKGSVDLGTLTESLGLKAFSLDGKMDYSASVNGILDLSKKALPLIDASLSISEGRISSSEYPYPLQDINASFTVTAGNGKYSGLKIVVDPFTFKFEEKPFMLTAKLEDFENLKYVVKAQGDINLDNIYKIFGLENATIKGLLQANLKLAGNQADAKNGKYNRLDNSGTLALKNFEYKSDSYKYPFSIPEALLTFDKERAWLKNTTLIYNKNNLSLDGYAQNYMGYYFEGGDLLGRLTVTSPQVDLDDFACMYDTTATTEPSEGVIQIPVHMNLTLNAGVRSILYDSLKAKDFSGEVAIKNGAAELRKTKITLAGAKFLFSAGYKPIGADMADFNFTVKADSFDIKRAYNEIPVFKELMSSAAGMEGKVSAEYNLRGKLNSKMEPVYPGIKGGGFIRLEDVNVKGFKILGAVSKATGRDSLKNNPNLKAVLIKTTIANNIMTIERTKLKIFGFRPRFEGQASLDGKLNIKFRLGLPPLGIVGIPMTITGTMDNPKVNMRRGKEEDLLEEEKDETEIDLT